MLSYLKTEVENIGINNIFNLFKGTPGAYLCLSLQVPCSVRTSATIDAKDPCSECVGSAGAYRSVK